jgi:hypothetical protein
LLQLYSSCRFLTALLRETEMKRLMTTKAIANRDPELQEARNTLRRLGWSQSKAARPLGVTRPHLNLVLTGHRKSRRLLEAIKELQENPRPA